MAIDSEKDLQNLRNRFRDLADKAFQQNIFTFTGFLGLGEQDTFFRMEQELRYAGYTLEGGVKGADRRMLRFGNPGELGYEIPFPIVCIHIRPLLHKFAEKLSHRDFLGALMNLGIERSTIGDILVGDREAYLFCTASIAEYICTSLEQIKHTRVHCSVTESWEEIPGQEPVSENVQLASLRTDAFISKVYHMSRGECLELFRTGRVFVDGRLCENNSRLLKGGETVSVRGYGKFSFTGQVRETKKGRLNAEAAVFR